MTAENARAYCKQDSLSRFPGQPVSVAIDPISGSYKMIVPGAEHLLEDCHWVLVETWIDGKLQEDE